MQDKVSELVVKFQAINTWYDYLLLIWFTLEKKSNSIFFCKTSLNNFIFVDEVIYSTKQ